MKISLSGYQFSLIIKLIVSYCRYLRNTYCNWIILSETKKKFLGDYKILRSSTNFIITSKFGIFLSIVELPSVFIRDSFEKLSFVEQYYLTLLIHSIKSWEYIINLSPFYYSLSNATLLALANALDWDEEGFLFFPPVVGRRSGQQILPWPQFTIFLDVVRVEARVHFSRTVHFHDALSPNTGLFSHFLSARKETWIIYRLSILNEPITWGKEVRVRRRSQTLYVPASWGEFWQVDGSDGHWRRKQDGRKKILHH